MSYYFNELEQKFYVPSSDSDYKIEIIINGKDEFVRKYILEHIFFELGNEVWKLQGLPVYNNGRVTSRILFCSSVFHVVD